MERCSSPRENLTVQISSIFLFNKCIVKYGTPVIQNIELILVSSAGVKSY